MKIEVWSDVVCPFCYIGSTQFEKALSNFEHRDEVEVVYRSFQLRPDAPREPNGKKGFEELARDKGVSVDEMKAGFSDIAERGREEGLEMKMLDTVMVNTFDAHKLIHFAAEQGGQARAVKVLYESYFGRAENVASIEVLTKVAAEIGLDTTELKSVLNSEVYSKRVKADIDKAAQFGIQGVPAFIADESIGTTGARGVDGFTDFIEAAWKNRKPSVTMMSDDDAKVCKDNNCL